MEKNVTQTTARSHDNLMIVVASFCCLMLCWLGIAHYDGYNDGFFDMGIMSQSIWSGTQGGLLESTTPDMGNRSRLNVHVEFIYFLLVPFYKAIPDPRVLIVAQAALFALGVIPVYRMAMRHTRSRFVARAISSIYLLYPTALTSVLADFHGDTLAMPILLFVLDALDQRAWRRYALFVILALSCKYYVAMPIAIIGMLQVCRAVGCTIRTPLPQQQVPLAVLLPGLLTATVAVCYGALAFFVIRPAFAPAVLGTAATTTSYIAHYFGDTNQLIATLHERILNAIIIFMPVILMAWRGWVWLLPGMPLAVAMLLSTGPGASYNYSWHHYAIVVPFIIMATIEGTARAVAAPTRRRSWRGDMALTVMIVFIFSMFLVDTPLNPFFWLKIPGRGRDPSVYGITPRDTIKDSFLAGYVPSTAPVAASNNLSVHLANRKTLYLMRYPDEPPNGIDGTLRLATNIEYVDYVVADALFDYYIPLDNGYGGGVYYECTAIALVMRDPAFQPVASRDGLYVFQRDAPPDAVLHHSVTVVTDTIQRPHTLFGDEISLLYATIEQVAERRFRATFEWIALGDHAPRYNYVAVSRLDGVAGARVVHLPTYALYPPTRWQPGQRIIETIEVMFQRDIPPGDYLWRVGWYRVDHPYSYMTDERSRLPQSQDMGIGTITLTP